MNLIWTQENILMIPFASQRWRIRFPVNTKLWEEVLVINQYFTWIQDDSTVSVTDLPVALHVSGSTVGCSSSVGAADIHHFL